MSIINQLAPLIPFIAASVLTPGFKTPNYFSDMRDKLFKGFVLHEK